MVTDLRHNSQRVALGFLTVAEIDELAESGVMVLDPYSTLISKSVEIGVGTTIYPGVVIQQEKGSLLRLGTRNILYPGCFLQAAKGGRLIVGDSCELGPGGVQIKANLSSSNIVIGNGVRLLNGAEVTGMSELGDGTQIIGQVSAQSVRLGGGLGGYEWPEVSERGALLKGTGLARDISLERGEVMSCQPSFAAAEIELQTCYHPGGVEPSS